MRQIEDILKELAEVATTPKEDVVVADFWLYVKVMGNGKVQISSPQNPQTALEPEPKPEETLRPFRPHRVKFAREGWKVSIDGVEYISLQEASRALQLHPYHIKSRCGSDLWPTWNFLD